MWGNAEEGVTEDNRNTFTGAEGRLKCTQCLREALSAPSATLTPRQHVIRAINGSSHAAYRNFLLASRHTYSEDLAKLVIHGSRPLIKGTV